MSHGITFALLSMVFTGINDVVFKRYSQRERSKGMYVFGIGVIWTGLQVVSLGLKDTPLSCDEVTLGFGLTAGFVLTLSNILLLESLTHIDLSLGSTIYRLNTIGVIILSSLFLREPLGILKVLGILCGVFGVLLLHQKRGSKRGSSHGDAMLPLFFGLIVGASLLRAVYGVIAKAGLLLSGDPHTMLLLVSSSWIVGGTCYASFREKRLDLSGGNMAYSLLSGILAFLIVNFLMAALESGEASIVIPIANMSFIVALFLSTMTKMEVLTLRKLCAILCAAGSLILLSSA